MTGRNQMPLPQGVKENTTDEELTKLLQKSEIKLAWMITAAGMGFSISGSAITIAFCKYFGVL